MWSAAVQYGNDLLLCSPAEPDGTLSPICGSDLESDMPHTNQEGLKGSQLTEVRLWEQPGKSLRQVQEQGKEAAWVLS